MENYEDELLVKHANRHMKNFVLESFKKDFKNLYDTFVSCFVELSYPQSATPLKDYKDVKISDINDLSIKSKAILNAKMYDKSISNIEETPLHKAFHWEDTIEGHDYWQLVVFYIIRDSKQ